MKRFNPRSLMPMILALLFSTPLMAQDAKSLLNEVSAKIRSYDNIVIDFKWTLQNTKENVQQETRGDVSLQGEKYLLNMLGTTRIFDGQNIYTIVPEDEEVTISGYSEQDDKEITPSRLLTFYEKGYNHQMDIVQTVKGRKIQYVKLTPIDYNAEIKNILLGIDMRTKHIYKLIQTDDAGTQYTLTVMAFKTDQPLSNTLFTFDEQKFEDEGYYINKLD